MVAILQCCLWEKDLGDEALGEVAWEKSPLIPQLSCAIGE